MKRQRGHKIHWRRAVLAGVLTALVAGMVPIVRAFKIGAPGFPPIHENITNATITVVMIQANPMFVSNVQSGVYNPDISHHFRSEFHFDDSTAGDGNGGFTNGFVTTHDMLNRARLEAVVWDANGVGSVNPLFLNPQHTSFRDLAEDIVGTYSSLSVNGGCLNEPACPTTEFVAGAAYLQAEVLPILLDTDPDPDEVTAFTITEFNINVPNFADDLAEVKSNLDGMLGKHCRPAWSFSNMCFDTLELMAPDDNDFQLLAGHLRILQYEYQAYYAWQHLGHALHTTQDFFAHSNYVELAGGRTGPQCDPNSAQAATICDAGLDITKSGPWTAIPLPSDEAGFISSLSDFRNVFSTQSMLVTLNGLPKIFGNDDNFRHLQTGYYPCGGDPDGVGTAPQGFPYCHTSTQSWHPGSAGLNKDKPYENGDELNHLNWGWAAKSAERMSVVLFGAFMADLLGPASGNYISAVTAGSASQRQGEMAWLSTGGTTGRGSNLISPWQIAPGGKTAAGYITANNLTVTPVGPSLSVSVCPSADGKSCASDAALSSSPWDIVTVTSGGAPVGGVNVSTGLQSLATTNVNGVAVITRLCYSPSAQVAKVGGTTLPVRTPIPCRQRTAMVSMAGYQPVSFSLP